MHLRIQKQIRVKRKHLKMLQELAFSISQKLFHRRVPAAREIKRAELSLLLTTNAEIKKINKKWRNKNKATDVLSFPQWTREELAAFNSKIIFFEKNKWILGDIVISVEWAENSARLKNITIEEELRCLFVHGVVHLLGYDHEIDAREEQRMKRVERYLLTQ